MEKQYVIGRDNFALTVFIPVDCKNNCPFCTSKSEYATNTPNLTNVIASILEVGSHNIPFQDIVITGGEPFADLGVLKKVIHTLKYCFPEQKCFINTSLPRTTLAEAIKYINKEDYITGVNISRHLKNVFSEKVASDEELAKIRKPKHLNCVLFNENVSDEDLIGYCDRMEGLGQPTFRADYRTITQSNLHSFDHKLFQQLDRLFGYDYSSQCHVCHTDRFNNGCVLHRGIELSHIEFANKVEVNDLIIKQNGEIRYDWDPEYVADEHVLSSLSEEEEEVYDFDNLEDDEEEEDNTPSPYSFTSYGCGGAPFRNRSDCGAISFLYGRCGGYTFGGSGCGG